MAPRGRPEPRGRELGERERQAFAFGDVASRVHHVFGCPDRAGREVCARFLVGEDQGAVGHALHGDVATFGFGVRPPHREHVGLHGHDEVRGAKLGQEFVRRAAVASRVVKKYSRLDSLDSNCAFPLRSCDRSLLTIFHMCCSALTSLLWRVAQSLSSPVG